MTIVHLPRVDSTQSVIFALAGEGAPDRTVVVADYQAAGRGRRGRLWDAPAGTSLLASILLRPSGTPARWGGYSLVSALAVADALARIAGVGARLKWPNDVLVGGLKTSGILMELGAEGSRVAFLVLGIGVNLNVDRNAFPEEFRALATSLRSFRGASVDRLAFVRRMYHGLEALLDAHATGGFEAVRPRFERRFAMAGRPVRVRDATRPEAPDAETAGVVEGIGADGALLLRREDGTRARVVAGDVTIVKPPRGSALRDGGGGSA